MPRITKRSPLNRKPGTCQACGKYVEKPYVYQLIPSYDSESSILPYSKASPKIKRSDLTGYRKVQTENYCDQVCFDNR